MLLRRAFAVLLLPLLLLTAAFQSFEPIGQPTNPNAAITFPPPIYLLRGQVEIRGTANLQGMVGHYVEFRPLNVDFTPLNDTTGWTPATLPINTPVIDDVLGVWDTTLVDDGAYEIRLSIITSTGTVNSRVSPLRIENNPPPFVIIDSAVPTQIIPTQPQVAQPTQVTTTGPTATALSEVNVRRGDSTRYDAFTFLRRGETVPIVGISSTGSGWWVVQLTDGRQGFVAPSTVSVTGNTGGLPVFTPPPPPATPTPLPPTAPPTSSLPDGTISNVRFDRAIKQGEAFQIVVTVYNGSSTGMGPVVVACNFRPQNAFFSATLGGLGAFTQTDVAITAQLDSGGGSNTTADCAIDVNNLIAEISETNNYFSLTSPLAAP